MSRISVVLRSLQQVCTYVVKQWGQAEPGATISVVILIVPAKELDELVLGCQHIAQWLGFKTPVNSREFTSNLVNLTYLELIL